MARNAAGWKGTIVGWPETEEKRRRQVTPNKCGKHVCLYEQPSLSRPPLDSFLLLRGVFPPVDEVAMGQSHDGGSAGWLRLPPILCQWSPLGPPQRSPVNPQGHQCGDLGDLGGRTVALAPSPDPTMVISLTPSSHSHSFVASSLRRQVRHVRGPLRPFAAARKRLEHTAYTIRTVKREPPPSGQPKESALASATGQGDQRCWAFRAEILGSISTTRCHPSASCWPRSNPPSYRHPASGFGSSNRRGPSRIDVMPVRDGEGNHCTQHSDLGVTPGPWLAEWRFFSWPNGPSVTCCATTQTGDGEMGLRIPGFCTTILQFWSWSVLRLVGSTAPLTALRILIIKIYARRVCSVGANSLQAVSWNVRAGHQ